MDVHFKCCAKIIFLLCRLVSSESVQYFQFDREGILFICEPSDEEILWSLGLLGMFNPQVLLNTLVYYLGVHCALWAGIEHHVLRSIQFDSQFKFLRDNEGSVFIRFQEDVGMKAKTKVV